MSQVKLDSTCTVYMDGTAAYTLKYVDKPGIITSLVLSLDQKEALEKILLTSR